MSSFLETTQLPNYTCVALDGSKVGVSFLGVSVLQAASISESGVPFLVYMDIL